MKLHQLSNGNWIDLKTIKAIRALPRERGFYGDVHADRLIIEHGQRGIEILNCDDAEQCVEMRDEIAALVNSAA